MLGMCQMAALCKWEHWDAWVGVLVTALPRMGAQRDARLRHSTGARFSRVQSAHMSRQLGTRWPGLAPCKQCYF